MFKLFASKFVKDYKNYNDPIVRLNLISLSSIIAISVNLLLVVFKLIVGFKSNSTAMINDGFNNLGDSVVAIMAYAGSKLSKKPADKEHPHGHGRGEAVMTLLVSILIMYIGTKLLFNSLSHFKDAIHVGLSTIAIIVLVVSILAKLYIYRLNRKLYIKLDSDLNYGVMVDSRNDMMATGAIIIGAFLQKFVDFNVDAVIGIFLAVLIVVPGVHIFRENVSYLMGRRVNPELEQKIWQIIMENEFIVGFHNLEIHDYGRGHMDGSVDVEIAQNLSLLVAHRIITDIQKKIRDEVGIKLSIHLDPTYTLIMDEEIKQEIKNLETVAKNEYEDF